MDFARRSEPRVTDLDLVAVARDTVSFLRGKQPVNVELEERYPSGPVPVSGDRSQLVQVVTNILNNAYEALEHGGRIVIEVRRLRDRAEVEIIDSGPGIPEEALPHIFEPFFTTKEEGKGTGLGLAICHGILQAHHGTIRARNVPGAGACFVISLPARRWPDRGRFGTLRRHRAALRTSLAREAGSNRGAGLEHHDVGSDGVLLGAAAPPRNRGWATRGLGSPASETILCARASAGRANPGGGRRHGLP